MSTKADHLGERVIVTSRAYVRLVEVADVLLDHRLQRGTAHFLHPHLSALIHNRVPSVAISMVPDWSVRNTRRPSSRVSVSGDG